MKKNDDGYPSKYSNGKSVSAAQYITELICENKARIEKTDLHFRFWQTPKWSKFFRNQIASAHKLLKEYDMVPIVRALKSASGSKIYSLRAPHLIQIIELETTKYANAKTQSVNIDRIDNPKIQNIKYTPQSKPNILSLLEDIDNGD